MKRLAILMTMLIFPSSVLGYEIDQSGSPEWRQWEAPAEIGQMSGLVASPDGRWIAQTIWDAGLIIEVWDMEQAELIGSFGDHKQVASWLSEQVLQWENAAEWRDWINEVWANEQFQREWAETQSWKIWN